LRTVLITFLLRIILTTLHIAYGTHCASYGLRFWQRSKRYIWHLFGLQVTTWYLTLSVSLQIASPIALLTHCIVLITFIDDCVIIVWFKIDCFTYCVTLITFIDNYLITNCFTIHYLTYCVTRRQYSFQLMFALMTVTNCFLEVCNSRACFYLIGIIGCVSSYLNFRFAFYIIASYLYSFKTIFNYCGLLCYLIICAFNYFQFLYDYLQVTSSPKVFRTVNSYTLFNGSAIKLTHLHNLNDLKILYSISICIT